MRREYPILEFDPERRAMIEPVPNRSVDMPEHCVVCFFQDVITALREAGRMREVWLLGSEMGTHPVYELDINGRRIALFHPGVGAPLAAAFLDEVIGLGCRKFIACGGAGVLNGEIAMGHLVVPTSAVRDEGVSYHYLPPSREVTANPTGVAAIEGILQEQGASYLLGKTWTTDAIYRETPTKVQRRRDEGCLTVEMEAAAFFAVAEFRGVIFAQILYGGDSLGGDEWDSRDWVRSPVRERLLWLAIDACLRL
ncbi:MAG: nucleoside phosphorylase [Chloroflexota bacterium]|nr:nucleoside phosphorylase [Chloroflexota bacterium]